MIPRSITIAAPAKVNLSLEVLKRRRDGYHDIVTVFERISLADTIRIRTGGKGIDVSSDIPIVRRREENIAYKAAKSILDFAACREPVTIHITKRIPIAAGLGGGSSDAASVLMGINRLLVLKVAGADLMALGAAIGADVPFFLSRARFALGTGRGDEITPLRTRRIFYHLLINPAIRLSTREVYERLDRTAGLGSNIKGLPPGIRWGTGSSERGLKGLTNRAAGDTINPASFLNRLAAGPDSVLRNDLQGAAIERKKEIGRIIERLAAASATKAIISGSGPSVFCLFRERKEAVDAKQRLVKELSPAERRRWSIFVVSTR